MLVRHVGYARKSRRGRVLKLDISVGDFLRSEKYRASDGRRYVNLLIEMDPLGEMLEDRRETARIIQIANAEPKGGREYEP